jgi:hypothetical protein
VEESEDDDVNSGKLITPDVPTDPEFANLARIELTEAWTSSTELNQTFWCLAEFLLDLVGTKRVVARGDYTSVISHFLWRQ